METESFPGIKVDEILADFFVRKYDGKLKASDDSSVSSNHSSGSKKENSKKVKKKKKHKSKKKKSKHKHSSRRSSRSPGHSQKHQSRSSDSDHREQSKSSKCYRRYRSRSPRSSSHRSRSPESRSYRSRSPKSRSHRSRSPESRSRRSRSPESRSRRSRSPVSRNSKGHRSRSPRHSERKRSRSPENSAKHNSRSPRHSRRYRNNSSHSDRSRSPRHKHRKHSNSSARESKSPDSSKKKNKASSDSAKSEKGNINQIKDDQHPKEETCGPEEDRKPVIPVNHKTGDSNNAKSDPLISVCESKESGEAVSTIPSISIHSKQPDIALKNETRNELHDNSSYSAESEIVLASNTHRCVTENAKKLSVDISVLPSSDQHLESKIPGNVEKALSNIGMNTKGDESLLCDVKQEPCGVLSEGNYLNENTDNKDKSDHSETDTCTVDIRCSQVSERNVSAPKGTGKGDRDVSDNKSNLENSIQTKPKIVFKDLKCSSFVKTLYNCDNIDLPKDSQPVRGSDSAISCVNKTDNVSDKLKNQETFVPIKSGENISEGSDKSSDLDQKGSPREKKKKKHSKDKKHKRNKDKKHKRRKRSHSRERSLSPKKNNGREKFDKVKLLNVARRNVFSMLEKGTLPQGINVDCLRHEQLISIKAGGKSVQELTEFCQALSKREDDDNDKADEDASKNDEDSDQPFIHHPFKLREQSVITMNIKNATQLPVKTHAEKVAENARLTQQFPVSSGSQHRQKEMEWIPVEKDDKIVVLPATEKKVATKPSVKEGKKTVENVITKAETPVALPEPVKESPNSIPNEPPAPLPSPPQPPVPPPPPSQNAFVSLSPIQPSYPAQVPFFPCDAGHAVNLPSVSASGTGHMFQTSGVPALTSYGMNTSYMPPAAAPPTPVVNAFPALSAKNIDLSAVVADRLKAVRKLQENPNDPEGLSLLHHSEQKLQAWVQSQQVPGKFTGSTDAKLLSAHELSGPNPVWTRKDSLIRAAPVTEGKGMSLMKKMGWNPGEGLGKNKEGTLEPLVLDIKMDKKGLVSEGEEKRKKTAIAYCHKHPVSVLAELCSKRKWSPPLYTCINESGPSHKRLFLFKVNVNDVDYQPKSLSQNKKLAKAQAAVLCLNAMGVTSSEYIMPT